MSATLRHQSYGKHRVRISKIRRPREGSPQLERHEFIQVSIDIELEGDFAASYTHRDNSQVIATDTCRNTVYVLAKDDSMDSIELFGIRIAEHFIHQYDHVDQATVRLSEHRWHRLLDSPHAFIGTDQETPTASVVSKRDSPFQIEAGIEHLLIAKTTQSGFSDFHRDEFRTLPDTSDRILATELQASWRYTTRPADFNVARNVIREALLKTFIDHFSYSVQDTLYRMGQVSLEAEESIESITLTMPNKHHLRFDLSPFHRSNDNEIFVVTDEPFGFIHATIARA